MHFVIQDAIPSISAFLSSAVDIHTNRTLPVTYHQSVVSMAAALQLGGHCCLHCRQVPRISGRTKYSKNRWLSRSGSNMNGFLPTTSLGGRDMFKNGRVRVMSPDVSSPSFRVELLDAVDDEYGGIVINPDSLPSSANAFASALRYSFSKWKLEGKKGVWLKILLEQSDLIPIAIKEGFNYHHAEPGYVMLTYWIPEGPCLLPGSPSHQIGVAAFVINDNREVLAVKEKCSFSCSGVWKMPTGYINKSEDLSTGVIREVKEETGVDTIFLKLVAFRHAHLVAFENSDLLFMCLLKPLSNKITIDENEIQAAKWMGLDEFMNQPFYEEDHMSRTAIGACITAYDNHCSGFTAQQLISKLDGKLSILYYDIGI